MRVRRKSLLVPWRPRECGCAARSRPETRRTEVADSGRSSGRHGPRKHRARRMVMRKSRGNRIAGIYDGPRRNRVRAVTPRGAAARTIGAVARIMWGRPPGVRRPSEVAMREQRSIFRYEAARRYSQAQNKAVFPRVGQPGTLLAMWIALALVLVAAGCVALYAG